MTKKMLLVFLCFTLFLTMPGCKKKLPTQPDIPTVVLPTIEYFHATPTSIMVDELSILSWSTKNATNITIDQGIGTISAQGTKEVSPEETTIYTLTATNSDGSKTSSCTVEILKWAVLELSTTPESPMFYYDPESDICTSDLTFNMTETAGVGGQIDSLLIGGFLTIDPESICSSQEFGGGTFDPFQTLSRYCELVIPCKPTIVLFYIRGIDNNGYGIDQSTYFTITWTQSMGTMRFLKIVEGASHHKLIK
ncbi:hypothetical protein ES703_107008 [subsurface metagenome]|nr:hypothetical protein [bacterium]